MSEMPEGAAGKVKRAGGWVAQPLLAVPAASFHVIESIASYKPTQAGVPELLDYARRISSAPARANTPE